MPKITLPYSPRDWQKQAEKELDKFTVMVVHRRAGKTFFAVEQLFERALFTNRPRPQVAYIAPSYKQAKQVCWEYIKQWAKCVPNTKVNESELRVDLPNGGRIMVLGAENPDSLRGIYLDYAILDEVADMPENLWGEVVFPTLTDRSGGALFIGTPKGRNYFHDLYVKGKTAPGWNSLILDINDTDVFKREEEAVFDNDGNKEFTIEDIEKEYVGREEEYRQEYECDWDAAIKGSYYGKLLDLAEKEKRVSKVPYDSTLPVITAWDIGLDGNAVWFVQIINDRIHIVDYIHESEKDITETISTVKNRPYMYDYAILPHDVKKRIPGALGATTNTLFKNAGLKTKVTPKLGKQEGIQVAKSILSKCYFDYDRTQDGLNSLRQYRAKYDSINGVYLKDPVHDEHSHPADAFRYLAIGLKKNHDYNKDFSFDPVNKLVYNMKWDNRSSDSIINTWDPFR